MLSNELLHCPKCNSQFLANSKTPKKFCSRKCANSRQWSESDKIIKSKSAKNSSKLKALNNRRWLKTFEKRECFICEIPFKTKKNKLHHLCSKCRKASNEYQYSLKLIRRKDPGGYREGSGRSHGGYYQGIYCASTYELAWVAYMLHHRKQFKRFPGYIIYDGNKKYYPDFLYKGKIIEIKGYDYGNVDAKTQAARDLGFKIEVLYRCDLEKHFVWYKHYFGKNPSKADYDGYRPAFTYNCSHCNKEYHTDRQKKTSLQYCSRECSGKRSKNGRLPLASRA